MTLKDLQDDVYSLGYETVKHPDDFFINAANRALRIIFCNNKYMKTVRVHARYPERSLYAPITHYKAAPVTLPVKGRDINMFRKELSYYFSTPIAYIVIGLFLLSVSLFLWVIPGQWNVIESGYAQVDGLFQISPWLLMLVCPALTMRLFAEERQSGTWILLRAQPITLWKIVVGKYMAAFVLTVMALLPCIVHYFIVFYMAEPIGNIDGGQFIGSMMGLVFLSASFIGIGLLCSTLTKSQLVSFILGAVSCFVLYWVTLQDHYSSISRGVVDLRDVVFFLSVAVAAIVISIIISERISKR